MPTRGETDPVGGNPSERAEWVDGRDPATGHASLKRYARRRTPDFDTVWVRGGERHLPPRKCALRTWWLASVRGHLQAVK